MDSKELQEAYGEFGTFTVMLPGDGEPQNSYERVREFHEVFGHPIADKPTVASDARSALRLELILEEFIELVEASGFDASKLKKTVWNRISEPNIVEIADALGDLDYVVNGAALEHGVPLPEITAEVHRSNMTKLGPEGKPIYREDGKILKGEGYERPNLSPILGL